MDYCIWNIFSCADTVYFWQWASKIFRASALGAFVQNYYYGWVINFLEQIQIYYHLRLYSFLKLMKLWNSLNWIALGLIYSSYLRSKFFHDFAAVWTISVINTHRPRIGGAEEVNSFGDLTLNIDHLYSNTIFIFEHEWWLLNWYLGKIIVVVVQWILSCSFRQTLIQKLVITF